MNPLAPSTLEIHLLGPFRVVVEGAGVDARSWSRRSATMLVKLLALQHHHQLHREQVMEMLWPELDLAAATNNLHKTIHAARRALEPRLKSGSQSRFLLSRGQQILLTAPDGAFWIDVEQFERQAKEALNSSSPQTCENALRLYAGDLLMEDLYEDWAAARREQLRALRQDVLVKLAQLYERRGDYQQSIERLKELLADDAANEEAHRQLMRLYAGSGSRHQALQQYQQCREAVRRELDAEPDAATIRLYDRIAAGRIEPLPTHETEPRVSQSMAIDSLAILPLLNAANDPEGEYLSDGITESIINSLSRLRQLRVMARSTVFRYKGKEADPRDVGQQLGVGAVLTGRLQQMGDTVIISTELVAVADGSQLWGEQYNRKLADIFVVQEEIAKEVSEKLRLRFSGEEQQQLAKRHTENAEAYRAYLMGRYFWNKRTEENLHKAIESFQQAITIDANYALAYAGLADAYTFLGDAGISVIRPKEAFARGKAAALTALQFDDTLAEAHASLAHIHMHHYEWQGAERRFRRTFELNPNYAIGHNWYAFYLAFNGRLDEALTEMSKALTLDPLSLPVNTDFGQILYYAHRYDEAITQLHKAIEIDPYHIGPHRDLGRVYEQKQMWQEAIAEFQKARELSGDSPEMLASLSRAYASSGQTDEALKLLNNLQELSEHKYVSPYNLALIYAGLGDKDQAFEWLHKAYEEYAAWMIYVTIDPRLNSLRSDERFRELVERVGLKVQARPAMAERDKAIESLAILPLINADGDASLDYLSDGITESLINTLSQLPGLKVMAWSSVSRYKGKEIDSQAVGRELKVGAVFTGRVLHFENRIVIRTELVNMVDGTQLWGSHFNREQADIFLIEKEISSEISKNLRVKLSGDDHKRLAKRPTDNLEAYHAYLKGRYFWYKRTEEALRKGIEYFNQAIEHDPGYAAAYAGLSDSYALLALRGMIPAREAFVKAKAAARKALEIDDTLGEAYASLAHVRLHDWDWADIEEEFKRALELSPGHAIAYHWYSEYLMAMGRSDESIAVVKQAQGIDPLSPVISVTLAAAYYFARRYDEGIEHLRSALEVNPNHFLLHLRLGQAYQQKGMYEESIAEMHKAMTLSGRSMETLTGLAGVYAAAGMREEAQKLLEELNERSQQHYVSPYYVAKIYALLGDIDRAFAWLEKGYAERNPDFIELKAEPVLDRLRPDSRFEDLLRRIGLSS